MPALLFPSRRCAPSFAVWQHPFGGVREGVWIANDAKWGANDAKWGANDAKWGANDAKWGANDAKAESAGAGFA